MTRLELDGPPRVTGAIPERAAPSAPTHQRPFHPGALVRRRWPLILVVSVVVAALLMLVVAQIPKRATATSRVRVVASDRQTIFGADAQTTPEEERESLIVDLESPAVLRTAAAGAGVEPGDVDVVATSPRETLFVDVAVTADTAEAAVEIANAIPTIVAETRRDDIRAAAEQAQEALRAQAEDAITQAEELAAEVAELQAEGGPTVAFRAAQQRDALVVQYSTLIGQAFQIQRRAASPAVGFEVTSAAVEVERSLPPGPSQTIPLALLAGLLVGFGTVAVRDLVGGHLYREHFEIATAPDHLGLVRRSRGQLHEDDLRAVTGRLRALPELRDPTSMLVAVVDLGVPAAEVRRTASRLAATLAESGLEAALLVADFGADTEPRNGPHGPPVQVTQDAATLGPDHAFRVRRAGGSSMSAAWSPEAKASLELIRERHQVVLLDATAAGVDVESWLEAAVGPDLVLLVLAEGTTTQDQYTRATSRWDRAGVSAVSVMLGRQPPAATNR